MDAWEWFRTLQSVRSHGGVVSWRYYCTMYPAGLCGCGVLSITVVCACNEPVVMDPNNLKVQCTTLEYVKLHSQAMTSPTSMFGDPTTGYDDTITSHDTLLLSLLLYTSMMAREGGETICLESDLIARRTRPCTNTPDGAARVDLQHIFSLRIITVGCST